MVQTSPVDVELEFVPGSLFHEAVMRVRAGAPVQDEAEQLLCELSREERLTLLDGDTEFWAGMLEMSAAYNETPIVLGAIARVGVPGLRFSDGPRGVVMGRSTAFPVSMARGATWDVALEERVGRAIGREAQAQGANLFGGVCINLPRHPAWGRAQETYGEDPLLLGEFGAALVRGVQPHAMAVVKHYALNSMENARFTVDVVADDATLHEVYLPHFRRVVEEGVYGVMTAYNSVNGEWAGQNTALITEVLRERWGFAGVTISDFLFGLRGAGASLRAGLDVEAPFAQQRAHRLVADIDAGLASWEDVDAAARRILATQVSFYAGRTEEPAKKEVVFSLEHRRLSREVAATAMVLLKNEPVGERPLLPLNPSGLSSVAVIGRLGSVSNTGDHGSSHVRPPHVITPVEGLRAAFPGARILDVPDEDPAAAAAAAAAVDLAVVVVGYTAEDEGEFIGGATDPNPDLLALFPPTPEGIEPVLPEGQMVMGSAVGGDRSSLRLRDADVEIIRATAAANPRTVVVIVTAGAVITEEWRDSVPSVLIGWYGGSEGGAALADVLRGTVDAAGRLPYSIPTDESHLPFFDRDATSIRYDRWHGQHLLDRDGHRAAFPLGFGLSYTTFSIDSIVLTPVSGERFSATVEVANVGSREGRHVVQLYGVVDAEDFPRRVLIGFAPVTVAAGDRVSVTVTGSTRPLQRWVDGSWIPAASHVRVEAAAYSGDPDAPAATLALH